VTPGRTSIPYLMVGFIVYAYKEVPFRYNEPMRPTAGALLRAVLLLLALGLGVLAWDVYQVRALRPPADRSFEGFLKAGRTPAGLRIDDLGARIYWIADPARTLLRYPQPPVYAFDRGGALVDWTPGTSDFAGMISGAPVIRAGREATLDHVRAWFASWRRP
jgi:hypothetical protein